MMDPHRSTSGRYASYWNAFLFEIFQVFLGLFFLVGEKWVLKLWLPIWTSQIPNYVAPGGQIMWSLANGPVLTACLPHEVMSLGCRASLTTEQRYPNVFMLTHDKVSRLMRMHLKIWA